MPDALSPHALSKLIGSIYDCALDPSRWEVTLGEIRDAIESQSAVLHLNDTRHDRVLMHKSVGVEQYWHEQVDQYVPEIHGMLQPSLDRPQVFSRSVPPDVIAASPFVQNYLKPQGLVDMMEIFLMLTPTRYAGLGLAWGERDGAVTDHEIELACLLLPHLRRAVTIGDVLDLHTVERARMAEALNALRCAVILVNAQGTILHANRAAERILSGGDDIHSVARVLQAKRPAAAAELRAAIELAVRDEAELGKTGLSICLTGPDAAPVFAHVLPMTGGELRTRLQPEAVAAVFIGVEPDTQDGAAVLAAAYGLTPAEVRVLASLLAGRTVAETAAALGIAPTTARSQLDSIFSKTGVSRQAELIQLATKVASPATAQSRS